MSIDAPNLENETKQPTTPGFRFVFNILAERWILLTIVTFLGAISVGGFSWFGEETPVRRYQTYGDVVLTQSVWDNEFLRTVSAPSPFRTTATELKEDTSIPALATDIARALVQRDVADGGPWASVTTERELRVKATQIQGKIDLLALNDNVMRISVTNCDSPEEAGVIAEFAVKVFVENNRRLRLTEAENMQAFLEAAVGDTSTELLDAEQKEWAFKREHGFRDYNLLESEISTAQKGLSDARVKKDTILRQQSELSKELLFNNEQFLLSLNNVPGDVVKKLLDEHDALLQEKFKLSIDFKETYLPLQQIIEEMTETQAAIGEAIRQLGVGGPGGSDMWENRKALYGEQVSLRVELSNIEIREETLERQLNNLIPQIPEISDKKLESDELRQRTQGIRDRYKKYVQLTWDINNAIRQGAGRIERRDTIREATLIPFPSNARAIWVSFVIGGLIGFILAFCYALMQEVNDTSIRTIEDVNDYIGLEVIGTIPKMRFGKPTFGSGRSRRATYVTTVDEEQIDACIVTQHDPKSPISEAYRTLRTNFQFATLSDPPKTVMVTSAVPGEGKTTTAVNLAVTMADRGIRVLIVDTDLRRPNVHRVLRMERGPGLADVLREGLDAKSVIRPTRIENLWIISSGRVPPNPSELIGSDRMSRLMQQLGEEFDLVICDAPSVLVVTDPVLLATHVDTCIAVVSTRNVRRETVIRARKLLETAQMEVAGVVVNGLETTRRHYYYYYYYYDDGAPIKRKWRHYF